MIRWIKRTAVLGAAVLLQLYGAAAYYAWQLPDNYYVQTGSQLEVDTALHISAVPTAHTIQAAAASARTARDHIPPALRRHSRQGGGSPGDRHAHARPLRRAVRHQAPHGRRYGGGHGTGGHSGGQALSGAGGRHPDRDLIRSVDGQVIDSNQSLQDAIADSNGVPVTVTLERGEETCTVTLTPAYAAADNRYEAGIWVRDSSAGIGTITFYEPETGSFGGLGHPICDADTGDILPFGSGEAAAVTISQVVKGVSGSPGMLQGSFSDETSLGELVCNNRCGVFGTLYHNPSAEDAVPMALKQEIETGPAQILCTVSGDTPKAYDVMLEEIDYSGTDSTRNMTVCVTDPELLEITGGIVQGMSGSPILQNGRLVGAVTHVFVDDPTRGYGIFCENMVRYGLSGS